MTTIILIGDSIRIGYEPTLRRELEGLADVWAPEENVWDSGNVLRHLDEWVISRRPDLVHINCGLHDIKKEFGSSSPAVDIGQYESNLREIMQRVQSETHSYIIWATTTPVNQEWHRQKKEFDRFEADVTAYNSVARRVAQEFGVPINDLYAVAMKGGRDSLLQPDGVHFTEAAYELMGKNTAGYIRRRLKI